MGIRIVSLLIAVLGLNQAVAGTATMLMFQKQEPGLPAYPSRAIVTDRYLRLDDGVAQGDFVLFDRRARTIYSVTRDDETVFVIPPRSVDIPPPVKLDMQSTRVDDGDEVPTIAGRTPQHYRLSVAGKTCYDVVAVSGLMDGVVSAMGEFRQVLAGEHAKTLPFIPADMQEPCDLAINTFAPNWLLKYGLPVQEWDKQGNRRALLNFDPAFEVQDGLFKLPEGFRRYSSD